MLHKWRFKRVLLGRGITSFAANVKLGKAGHDETRKGSKSKRFYDGTGHTFILIDISQAAILSD